jgi:hypothetical protein
MKPYAVRPRPEVVPWAVWALPLVSLWMAPPLPAAEAGEVARMVRQLGSETFSEREAASRALDALGEPALPALREAVHSPDLEVRRRAAELLRDIETRADARERTAAIRALTEAVTKLGGRCKPGVDALGRPAVSVDLSNTAVTDADLGRLRGWAVVRELDLSRTNLTDKGLRHLREAAGLEALSLLGLRITDEGLEHLFGLHSLAQLTLDSTAVTAETCQRLSRALPRAVILGFAPPALVNPPPAPAP